MTPEALDLILRWRAVIGLTSLDTLATLSAVDAGWLKRELGLTTDTAGVIRVQRRRVLVAALSCGGANQIHMCTDLMGFERLQEGCPSVLQCATK